MNVYNVHGVRSAAQDSVPNYQTVPKHRVFTLYIPRTRILSIHHTAPKPLHPTTTSNPQEAERKTPLSQLILTNQAPLTNLFHDSASSSAKVHRRTQINR